MSYEKVLKWLQKACAKEDVHPELSRPAYMPKYEMTVATDRHRVHAVEEELAGKVDGYPDVIKMLEPYRPDIQATWTVDARDLRWIVKGLAWLAKTPSVQEYHGARKPVVSVAISSDGLFGCGRITSDAETTLRFAFDLPGRFEIESEAAVEVNPQYLADALEIVGDCKGTVTLNLEIPSIESDQPKALWISTTVQDQKRLAVIMPIKSRAFTLRVEAARAKERVGA